MDKALRDTFRAALHAQMDEAIKGFNADHMLAEICHEFEKDKRALVMAVLGIEHRFGEYEVRDRSPLGDWIGSEIHDQLQDFVKTTVTEEIEKVKKQARSTLKTAVKKYVRERSDYYIRDTASDVLAEIQAQMLKEVKQELLAEFTGEEPCSS